MTIKAKFSIILMILSLMLGSYTIVLFWNTYRNIKQIEIADLDFKVLLAAAEARTNIDSQMKEVANYLKFRNPRYKNDFNIYREYATKSLAEWKRLIQRTIELGKTGERYQLNNLQNVENLYFKIVELTELSFFLAEQHDNEGAFLTMKGADKWEKELFILVDRAMEEERAGLSMSYKQLLGRLPSLPWLTEKSSRMIEAAEMPIQFFLSIERTRSHINRQMKDALDFLLAAEAQEMNEFIENGVIARYALNSWIMAIQIRLREGNDKKEKDLLIARNVQSSYNQVLNLLSASFNAKLNSSGANIPDIMENQVDPLLENKLFPKLDEAISGCQDSMAATHEELVSFSYSASIQVTAILGLTFLIVMTLTVSLVRRTLISYGKITAGMKIIGDGRLDYRIDLKSNDELGQFAESFDNMTAKLQEVTRLEQEQERIAMSRERLAHVGEISAGVIHTIRNPLHGVINCTEILESRVSKEDENASEIISMMKEGLERIERVTHRLLALTRETPSKKTKSDVNHLVQDTIRFVRLDAEKKSVQLKVDLDPEIQHIDVDPDRISEAIINLLSNALDACKSGDEIVFKTYQCNDPRIGVCITIQDSGEGISEESMPKIMEPFFTTKPIGQGSGLGLPITRRIVEEHDGIFQLRSVPSQGTVIDIFLPKTSVGE